MKTVKMKMRELTISTTSGFSQNLIFVKLVPFLMIFHCIENALCSFPMQQILSFTVHIGMHIGCKYFEFTQICLVLSVDFSFKTKFSSVSRIRLWFWMYYCRQS